MDCQVQRVARRDHWIQHFNRQYWPLDSVDLESAPPEVLYGMSLVAFAISLFFALFRPFAEVFHAVFSQKPKIRAIMALRQL